MVHLIDNPFQAYSSPTSKSAYKRRRLFKYLVRAILISTLAAVCYLFVGRRVDPRDVDFIQYFCQHGIVSDNLFDDPSVVSESGKLDYLQKDCEAADTTIPLSVWDNLPVRGAYYMIVRNENLSGARSVIKSMEDHMTNGTQYPWVLLNNQHFSPSFKKYIRQITAAPVFFGKIDLLAWEYPHWIDVARAEYLMLEQEVNMVHKGSSLSHHQMLRYQAGFFFHHPLLKDVDYTWRVEPGADYSCQMDEDLFLKMKQQHKSLGFVLTMKESPGSIPTLWQRINEFKDYFPEYILPESDTIWPWIYDTDTDGYNLCHFWTNFQLADLSFFRSEAYQRYFEYLDNTGNFFYERWSDAPVQTIAAALFLQRDQLLFVNEIGYTHSIATHCPYNEKLLLQCSCDVAVNYDFYKDSCTKGLLKLIDPKTVGQMAKFVKEKNIPIPSMM